MATQRPRRRTNAPKRTPEHLNGLRENLAALSGSENALIRSAVRIALDELDRADLADDPAPHYVQVARILDAVLNPDDRDGESS